MKKVAVFGVLTAFMTLCAASGVTFAAASPQETGYVSVSANSYEEIEPNQAVVTFTVEAFKKDLKTTNEAINELSGKLSEALKEKIGEDDTIKTASYNFVPQYYQKDKKRTLTGYRATTKMTVTTKKLSELPAIISTALNNGAIQVSGLEFSLTDYNNKCNDLIAKASKKAHTGALAVAKSLNTDLNGVKNINAFCSTPSHNRGYGVMMKAAAADNASEEAATTSNPAIEPGTIKINANVDASFYVK